MRQNSYLFSSLTRGGPQEKCITETGNAYVLFDSHSERLYISFLENKVNGVDLNSDRLDCSVRKNGQSEI